MQVTLSAIHFSYPGASAAILTDASAVLPPGWTGVVGSNGCGKSTLARIAAGQLMPDAGSVTPGGMVAAYCEQDASASPACLEDFACAWDKRAVRLRADLGIEDDWPWRFAALSCGQQKRLQVAVALWEEPDLLVLDEPTNHVDAPTRRAIAQALAGFRGVGLLISHDRALLDGLVERCLFFSDGRVTLRPGTYAEAAAQADLERRSAERQRRNAKREVARVQQEAARRRNEASKAAAKRSERGLDPKDHDGKGRIKLAIYTGRDGVAGKLSARMDARLERAQEALAETRVAKSYDGDVWLDAAPSPRKVLLRMTAGVLARGAHRLEVPDLALGNADHVGVSGVNGSGKSTLIGRLVAALADDLPTLVVPQEVDAELRAQTLATLRAAPRAERGRILSIVAQLNSDPDRLLDGDTVSPGELRKLLLAEGIARRPALIVMDEPTNHLDLGSVEALERVLAAFPGALVLVSHDERLLDRATDIRWHLGPVAAGEADAGREGAEGARAEGGADAEAFDVDPGGGAGGASGASGTGAGGDAGVARGAAASAEPLRRFRLEVRP